MYSTCTPKDLKTLSKEHGDLQIRAQLDEEELKISASKWKFRHRIAYRLLVHLEKASLKVLVMATIRDSHGAGVVCFKRRAMRANRTYTHRPCPWC